MSRFPTSRLRLHVREFVGPLAFVAASVGSALGFFGYPIGLYDESALLLGARIVKAGGLPYRDFYTNYGPLSYGFLEPFLRLANPGVAYRAAQCATLGLLAILLFFACWLLFKNRPAAWGGAAIAVVSASPVLQLPQFLGFALTMACLGLFLIGHYGSSNRRRWVVLASAGVALGFLALVRPAFAMYLGLTFFLFLLLIGPARVSIREGATLLEFALLSAAACWFIWYSEIPFADFYAAAVRIPARLSRSSARFVLPYLVGWDIRESLQLIVTGLTLAAVYLAANGWVFATRGRAPRSLVSVGAALAASIPAVLARSTQPGRAGVPCTVLLMGMAAAAIPLARNALRTSPLLGASAACGLVADAFLHYFWSRPDQVHLIPSAALATSAALLHYLPSARLGRALGISVVLIAWLPFLSGPGWPFPIATVPGLVRRPLRECPASKFPSDATLAAGLADAGADPASRFVAVASNHRRTERSAVILFVLSRRPSYTRWYAYDPGIQSSKFVQDLMTRELQESGSATAVVWDARAFEDFRQYDAGDSPTDFDRRFQAIYPTVIGRFGLFQVRRRALARAEIGPPH